MCISEIKGCFQAIPTFFSQAYNSEKIANINHLFKLMISDPQKASREYPLARGIVFAAILLVSASLGLKISSAWKNKQTLTLCDVPFHVTAILAGFFIASRLPVITKT